MRGRVVDLCKPTQRKYETAVSVILGRDIDAIVVDEEKTAIECIEASQPSIARLFLLTFIVSSICGTNVLAKPLSYLSSPSK